MEEEVGREEEERREDIPSQIWWVRYRDILGQKKFGVDITEEEVGKGEVKEAGHLEERKVKSRGRIQVSENLVKMVTILECSEKHRKILVMILAKIVDLQQQEEEIEQKESGSLGHIDTDIDPLEKVKILKIQARNLQTQVGEKNPIEDFTCHTHQRVAQIHIL
jgi:hypothetical protein